MINLAKRSNGQSTQSLSNLCILSTFFSYLTLNIGVVYFGDFHYEIELWNFPAINFQCKKKVTTIFCNKYWEVFFESKMQFFCTVYFFGQNNSSSKLKTFIFRSHFVNIHTCIIRSAEIVYNLERKKT